MIDFSVLGNCLLQACFFKEHDGKVTKSEHQTEPNKLEQATYEHDGKIRQFNIEVQFVKSVNYTFEQSL